MTTAFAPIKRFSLDRLLLFCWYLTIFSAPFESSLLNFPLPIGGHFFLFRGMILLTCSVYLVYLIRRRENPLRGLSWPERWFVVLAICMLIYGAVSTLWAISLGAWFTKFFTMCQMFALVFLFLKLCRDPNVLRNTMLLVAGTFLVCMLGGVVELFHGPFFDTMFTSPTYVFFNRWLYAPVFTMYNPNGFSVYLLFTLEILYFYLAQQWDTLSPSCRRRSYWLLSGSFALTLFLCCADGGRLSILSIPLISIGIAVWALLRYRKGLLFLALLALMLAFTYVGENYDQVKYRAGETISQIQEIFHPSTPSETPVVPSEPEKNMRGTLYTIIPSITEENVNDSLAESDGIRLALLKDSVKLLVESKGLGIGLGNAEYRIAEFDNTQGYVNVHCFIMEVVLEFGIFALLPLLIVVCSILRRICLAFYRAGKQKDSAALAELVLLFMTCAAFPLLSTANSSSWTITIMWLYLAQLLLYTGALPKADSMHIKGRIAHGKEPVHE